MFWRKRFNPNEVVEIRLNNEEGYGYVDVVLLSRSRHRVQCGKPLPIVQQSLSLRGPPINLHMGDMCIDSILSPSGASNARVSVVLKSGKVVILETQASKDVQVGIQSSLEILRLREKWKALPLFSRVSRCSKCRGESGGWEFCESSPGEVLLHTCSDCNSRWWERPLDSKE